MTSGTGLLTERDGPAVRLTLDRPERRNALTPELCRELSTEIEHLAGDPELRCVVLAGTGRAFCAGFDLERIGEGAPGEEARLVERVCSALRALPVPVVVRIQGAATGAGCDLAMACDLRIAEPDAILSAPPARLGFMYEPGGIARLVEAVGPSLARWLLITGEPIDATRAHVLGAVHQLAEPAALDGEVEAVVARITANAPLSVHAAKLTVNALAGGAPLPAGTLAAITAAGARVWASTDALEGPMAFRERRPPRFRGR